MILTDLARALGQFGDARFQSVLWRGVALALALLAGLTVLAVWAAGHFLPAHVTLPGIGAVGGLHALAGGAALVVMLVASIFLMVPVAAAFTGLFIDEVAGAVEARWYPGLPPARRQGWGEIVTDGLRLAALSVIVNLAALVLYVFSGPLAPFVFWIVNGFLLGREYAVGAAARRLPGPQARAAVRSRLGAAWALGTILAVPLSIPVINLVVPVVAAAAFTHFARRLPG